jgi:DNA polymerase III epsilon subunit-like protein
MVVITFDTETTGLLADPSARIIEVGAVRHNLKTGQILRS